MNRKVIIVIVLVAMIACLAACASKVETVETLPHGVKQLGDDKYYAIQLPKGRTVSDYFTLTGAEGTIVVTKTDAQTYREHMGAIHYRQESNGGWVVYEDSQAEHILYIPANFPEKKIQLVCSSLLTGANDYMTLEEAEKYLP